MWRLWVALGAAVWLITIGASGTINFIAASQFGRSPLESQAFGFLAIAADVWKAAGPIFIATLWREKRRVASAIASLVWLCSFTFAASAAIGLAAQNRSAIVGGREAIAISYRIAETDLHQAEQQRARLVSTRSPQEIESAISVVFSKSAGGATVGALTANCQKDFGRTRSACSRVAELRQELSAALEAHRLDESMATLKQNLSLLRERGALLDEDPQGRLISRLSFGLLDVADVDLGLVLLLVVMVELISAFAPLVVQEYATVRRLTAGVAAGRDMTSAGATQPDMTRHAATAGDLFEYIAACITPSAEGTILISSLFKDYVRWCKQRGHASHSRNAFVRQFAKIAKGDLGGAVYRERNRFCGLRFRTVARA